MPSREEVIESITKKVIIDSGIGKKLFRSIEVGRDDPKINFSIKDCKIWVRKIKEDPENPGVAPEGVMIVVEFPLSYKNEEAYRVFIAKRGKCIGIERTGFKEEEIFLTEDQLSILGL